MSDPEESCPWVPSKAKSVLKVYAGEAIAIAAQNITTIEADLHSPSFFMLLLCKLSERVDC
jgi:hypothetical protein